MDPYVQHVHISKWTFHQSMFSTEDTEVMVNGPTTKPFSTSNALQHMRHTLFIHRV